MVKTLRREAVSPSCDEEGAINTTLAEAATHHEGVAKHGCLTLLPARRL
jgi:hypothetical protein